MSKYRCICGYPGTDARDLAEHIVAAARHEPNIDDVHAEER